SRGSAPCPWTKEQRRQRRSPAAAVGEPPVHAIFVEGASNAQRDLDAFPGLLTRARNSTKSRRIVGLGQQCSFEAPPGERPRVRSGQPGAILGVHIIRDSG